MKFLNLVLSKESKVDADNIKNAKEKDDVSSEEEE